MRNLTVDTQIAKKNLSKVNTLIPKSLLLKEDKIAKKQKKSKESNTAKIKQLFKLTDELTSKISSVTSCKSGCGNCCRINVSITQVEAELISKETGKDIKQHDFIVKSNFHGQDCSFLKDDKCSIYAYRPFVCRRQVSMLPDDYWCHPDRSLDNHVPMLEFSELSKAYYVIANESIVKDIRQWFDRA
ncbi:YkgJ family cysteine cluster protein [Aliivibrio fischeri]|uniref:YkgJ family cysteine cluster protein n=2 Tax=Aliivibrio fischeri TaxID=668 RepID=A0A6N3Z137_ALIFS|nr:YkgJ family cysteine cluster protein [Aliivibrio fischeri]MUK47549.1 YkgJ family cysteine cluster protein [Aliivibrio fischeri]MUK81539.1 YkgJ family cysteine cluster protein [Aliivibrio fischeri]MUK86585.1 YkgJ family cysteine cluster protein [Aliivibrio fischeri]MUL04326.1 YkgJ family cysteine cluster protein [Aliivibrio fischeri]